MDVLLSIKPEYVQKIFSGEKHFEFRKILFSNRSVNTIYIYATAPEKKIVGKFTIKAIHSSTPEAIWNKTQKYGGIKKTDFDKYFHSAKVAHAIEIENFVRFSTPIDPVVYNRKFQPPQSFVYLNQKQLLQYHLHDIEINTGIGSSSHKKDKSLRERKAVAKPELLHLFYETSDYIRSLGNDITEQELRLYHAFKKHRNFSCLVLRQNALIVYLKLNPDEYTLQPGFTRDVREIGHWGTGDLEVTITDWDSLEKAKTLIQESYLRG